MIRFPVGSDGPEPGPFFACTCGPFQRHLRTLFIQTSSQPCKAFASLVQACPLAQNERPPRVPRSTVLCRLMSGTGKLGLPLPAADLSFAPASVAGKALHGKRQGGT